MFDGFSLFFLSTLILVHGLFQGFLTGGHGTLTRESQAQGLLTVINHVILGG